MNQLVRRHRGEVRKLLEAGERLRTAHERLLAQSERDALDKASQRERELVAGLVERAEPLLSEGGSPSEANLERVRKTLHAAALDDELRSEFEAGRVVRERDPAGLGPFAAAGAAARPKPRKPQRSAASERERRDARKRVGQAEKQLAGAERALERAQRALQEREDEVEEARAALDRARRALESTDS